jgi:hypothetical protein
MVSAEGDLWVLVVKNIFVPLEVRVKSLGAQHDALSGNFATTLVVFP